MVQTKTSPIERVVQQTTDRHQTKFELLPLERIHKTIQNVI